MNILKDYHKQNSTLNGLAKNLRKQMTKEERHLWFDFLQRYPVRFRRQEIIENYIADFYCARAKLVIELDGSQHYEPEGLVKDQIRTDAIEKYGILVLRFPNNAVTQNFEGVCTAIDDAVQSRMR